MKKLIAFFLALALAAPLAEAQTPIPFAFFKAAAGGGGGGGGPAFDTAVAVRGTVGGGNTVITQALTCNSCTSISGSVFINQLTSAVPTATVTYNGTSLTLAHTNACTQGTDNVVLYTYKTTATPTTGAHNLVITASSAPAQEFSMTFMSATGTTASSPIGVFGADVCDTSAVGTHTTNVTSSSGDLVVDSIYLNNGNGGAYLTQSPATQGAKWGTTGTQGLISYLSGTGGSDTITYAGGFGNTYGVGNAWTLH